MRRVPLVLCGALIVAGCPRGRPADRPVFTVSDEMVLRHDIAEARRLDYRVLLEHDGTRAESDWSVWVQPETDGALVRLVSEGGVTWEFTASPEGRTRGGGGDFTERLMRQLVWMRLPRPPASVGSSWEDPQWVEPFIELLPAGTAETVSGRSELVSLVRGADGVEAVVDSVATVTIEGRTVVDARGRGVFHVDTGTLVQRDVAARFYTPTGPDTLHIALTQTGGLGTTPGGRR